MKLTWFGGNTLRIHAGGQIVVMGAGAAPQNIDRAELLSGADFAVTIDKLDKVDLASWRPRRVGRMLDGDAATPMQCWAGANDAVLVEAAGESPLLVVTTQLVAPLGRWLDQAVVLLTGHNLVAKAEAVLQQGTPRLMVLAGSDVQVEAAFRHLPPILEGAGLMALEQGLALEV